MRKVVSFFFHAAVMLFLLSIRCSAATLDSDNIRLVVDDKCGAITSLVDKQTKRDWMRFVDGSSVYSLQLLGSANVLTLADAASVAISQDAPDVVVVTAIYDKPSTFAVTCLFRIEGSSGQILSRIKVFSSSSIRVSKVCFPVMTVRAPFSDAGGGEDRLLLPDCDGILIHDPAKNLGTREIMYPGKASLQMIAAYDNYSGLAVIVRDSAAYAKRFSVCHKTQALEISITHILPEIELRQWELNYDIAIAGLCRTSESDGLTWEDAADLYRAWAVTQPWCRKKMAQRVATFEVPEWITEPVLIVTLALRGQLPEGDTGDRIELIPEQVMRWRNLVGARVICLVVSWEKLGKWIAPNYFPPFGGEARFKEMLRLIHDGNGMAMVFLSGLCWTLHRDLAPSEGVDSLVDQQQEFDSCAKSSSIYDEYGKVLIEGIPKKDPGQFATICPTTFLAREILLNASRHCQELGIDWVQIDQIVGGGMAPCFNPMHDHPPGGGAWCSGALAKLFGEIRSECKRYNRDFVFSIEEPGEYYIPLLDTYHSRDLRPRDGKGVVGVPLFTHVYHDYIAGYGSEGACVTENLNVYCLYQIGTNLVSGKIPSIAIWDRWFEPEKIHPTELRLLRSHIELLQSPVGEFLNFGRRVGSKELDVPVREVIYLERDRTTCHKLITPSILHSSWVLEDGRECTIFASIAEKAVVFDFYGEQIRLEPGQAIWRSKILY